jgi:hypothetical protein
MLFQNKRHAHKAVPEVGNSTPPISDSLAFSDRIFITIMSATDGAPVKAIENVHHSFFGGCPCLVPPPLFLWAQERRRSVFGHFQMF